MGEITYIMSDPAITGDDPKNQDPKGQGAQGGKPATTGEEGSNNDPKSQNQQQSGQGSSEGNSELEQAQAKIQELSKENAQLKDLQSQADKRASKSERELRKIKKTLKRSNPPEEGGEEEGSEPTPVEGEEKAKAQVKIANLMIDPKYREVLDNDPTLRKVLSTNPLSLVEDFFDAEDAKDQVSDLLDERVSSLDSGNSGGSQQEGGKGSEGEGEEGQKKDNPKAGAPNADAEPGKGEDDKKSNYPNSGHDPVASSIENKIKGN